MPKGIPRSVNPQFCTIEGCGRPHRSKGFCAFHYTRWYKNGDPLINRREGPRSALPPKQTDKPWMVEQYRRPDACSIADCGRPVKSRGWCQNHYRRWRLYGDPFAKSIPASVCQFCGKPANMKRDYCDNHWRSMQLYGDPFVAENRKMSCDGPCLIDGCHRKRVGKGLCKTHYYDLIVLSPERVAAIYKRWEQVPTCKNGHPWMPESTVVTIHPHSNRPTRVCALCSRNHNRRRHAVLQAPDADPIDWYQVMERDQWLCQLCGHPIDRKARWPQALFGSVDHILPLSRGGRHKWENVQATHLYCNVSKKANDAPKELPPGYRGTAQLAFPLF